MIATEAAHDVRHIALAAPDDFEGWRDAARGLVFAGIRPEHVTWTVSGEGGDLYADAASPPALTGQRLSVPRAFVDLAQAAALHFDPERFALLYTLLWRLQRDRSLIEDHADPLVRRIEELAKQVRRDIHKMRAFVRFREIDEKYVAWFEPEHHIVRANAGFFTRRFANMVWSILTPEVSIHWNGETLAEGPGATRTDAPEGDPTEEVWKTYYASIFNPARVKIGAMLKEMPRKYWKNMPETALIGELVAGAQGRESGMIATSDEKQGEKTDPAAKGDNSDAAWASMRDEAMSCTRCDLYQHATRTVFGEGPIDADIVFVGEQPGDQEDLAGRPFVGPAGQVFDRALADAGIDRARVYVSNAVKHFKFEPRGKRRIHKTPTAGEVTACRWWIGQELDLIRPKLTVALGATAARSLFGKPMTIGKERGRAIEMPAGGDAWITVHPSYLLRLPDEAAKAAEYDRFVEDLRAAAKHAGLWIKSKSTDRAEPVEALPLS